MPRATTVPSCRAIFSKEDLAPLLQAWAELTLVIPQDLGTRVGSSPDLQYRTQGIFIHTSPPVPSRPLGIRTQENSLACMLKPGHRHWVRASQLGGREGEGSWSTCRLGGLSGRARCGHMVNPGREAVLSRPQLAPGDQGHHGSSVVPLSAQLVPSSLLPSLWPTCPELSVERGTQAELSGQLRALFLMEFSL